MSLSQRQIIRIASHIRDHLLLLKRRKRLPVQGKLGNITEQMDRLQAIRRKLNLCEARTWYAVSEKVMRQIEVVLRDLPHHIQQVLETVRACDIKVPSMAEIYRELRQAEEEFGGLVYHEEGDLLAVSTEQIELQDIYLGEFEIQLRVPSLAEMRYSEIYRIFALDPHPAASNDAVTHPHVNDGQLCPGDAGASIAMALAAGRFCDFFLLVRSVLTHYNPNSPYVSLDNWHGVACYECGYVASGDDVSWCSSCEHDYCDECSSYCRRCDDCTCTSCLENCPACEEPVCPSCLTRCPDCEEPICKTCLEEMQCPCIEENEENQDEESERTPTETEEASGTNEQDGDFTAIGQAPSVAGRPAGADAA